MTEQGTDLVDLAEMRAWADGRRQRCADNEAWNVNIERYANLVELLDELSRLRLAAPVGISDRLRSVLDAAGPYLPLKAESDWTWEIIGADGTLIANLPYPKQHAATFAELFSDGINALADIARATAPEAGKQVRAVSGEPAPSSLPDEGKQG